MKLVAREWRRVCYKYTLEITQGYLDLLNDSIKEIVVEDVPLITFDNVEDLYDDCIELADMTVHFKDSNGEQRLGDLVHDILDDDLWDMEGEMIGSDYLDNETEFVEERYEAFN